MAFNVRFCRFWSKVQRTRRNLKVMGVGTVFSIRNVSIWIIVNIEFFSHVLQNLLTRANLIKIKCPFNYFTVLSVNIKVGAGEIVFWNRYFLKTIFVEMWNWNTCNYQSLCILYFSAILNSIAMLGLLNSIVIWDIYIEMAYLLFHLQPTLKKRRLLVWLYFF